MANKKMIAEYNRKMKESRTLGRLYWRSSYPNWRSWSNDDICQIKNGTARTHFSTLEALDKYLADSASIPF